MEMLKEIVPSKDMLLQLQKKFHIWNALPAFQTQTTPRQSFNLNAWYVSSKYFGYLSFYYLYLSIVSSSATPLR